MVQENTNLAASDFSHSAQSPGRRALLTGAARGIGKAIAQALAGEGADIAINFQSSEADAVALSDELTCRRRQPTVR